MRWRALAQTIVFSTSITCRNTWLGYGVSTTTTRHSLGDAPRRRRRRPRKHHRRLKSREKIMTTSVGGHRPTLSRRQILRHHLPGHNLERNVTPTRSTPPPLPLLPQPQPTAGATPTLCPAERVWRARRAALCPFLHRHRRALRHPRQGNPAKKKWRPRR